MTRLLGWGAFALIVASTVITLIWGPTPPFPGCKPVCIVGQAPGNSCIEQKDTRHQGWGNACNSAETYFPKVLEWWSHPSSKEAHNPLLVVWERLGENYQSGLVFFVLDIALIVGVLPWYLRIREQARWKKLAEQQLEILNDAVNVAIRWELTVVEIVTTLGPDRISEGGDNSEERRIELENSRLRKKLNGFTNATSHASTPLSYFPDVAPDFFSALNALRELDELTRQVERYKLRSSLEKFHGDEVVPVMGKLVSLRFPQGWRWKLDPDVGRIGKLLGNDAPSWAKLGS